MTNPLITIGIACYNARDSIARAIQSALAQDWKNTEIIIVDDASHDNSPDLIMQAIKDVPHARLIGLTTNIGPGGVRARLLEEAKGEFIAFFDDDDVSAPNRLRTQYQRIIDFEIEKSTQRIACYASGERLYPNGYTLELKSIGSQLVEPHGKAMADRLLFYTNKKGWFYGTGTPTCSLMARRETLLEVGGFDPAQRRVEDVDFAIRLALQGGYFIGCPEKLFTQYATQGSDKSAENNKEAEIQLAEKYKEYLKSRYKYYYAKNWPLLRYYHFTGNRKAMVKVLLNLIIRHPFKTLSHLLTTGPKRLAHEKKMRAERQNA